MARKMIVVNAALEERHRAHIRAAADKQQFDVSFYSTEKEALPHLADAEIVFGQSETLAQNSPCLRWLCTPSAGVDQFLGEGVFASPVAVLTNSSGAYGVTIAEHIVMVTLELMRRRMDYDRIVASRIWKRDLPIRSICGSRITILGTGDLGSTAAARLRGFEPASITGMNTSGHAVEGFDRILPIAELDSILPGTDLLVMALPGTPQTVRVMC